MARKLMAPDCRARTCSWKLRATTELQLSQLDSTPHQPRVPILRRLGHAWAVGVLAALILVGPLFAAVFGGEGLVSAATLPTPSRSTTIAITADNAYLVVVNRETNTVSVIAVRDSQGQDIASKFAEIPVGIEPRCVAIHPNGLEAYVTNAVSGTVSVVDLFGARVLAEIRVGTEPRGCAITPNGNYLFVANHTEGSVGVIDVASRTYLVAIPLGGNPMAIAITNDGDAQDLDETVFVTQFFAELIPGGPGEGFDAGKRGIVNAISLANLALARIALSPLSDVGFPADRSLFCPQTNPNIHSPNNPIFCPDMTAPPGSPVITQDPQGAFPNQLFSALIRANRLFLPNIGAGPEPPLVFNVNVQALVHVVDTGALQEVAAEHVNLNAQIKTEAQPANPTESLGRLFGNDLVAIDASLGGDFFLIVSRGGNYVLRAVLGPNGQLDIGAPGSVIR